MEPRISLVTLGVGDLARARAFYAALGWRESGAGTAEVAFFQAGGMALALWGRDALAADAGVPLAPGTPAICLAHNVRTPDAVDALLAEAARAGARITTPARDTDWGGRAGSFADPDGFLWEIAWNPFFPLDADGRLTLPP